MGPLIAALFTLQIPLPDVEALVGKAFPSSSISGAQVRECLLITAETIEQTSFASLPARQQATPLMTESGAPPPPVVTHDQLMLVPEGSSAKPEWKPMKTAYALMDVDLGVGHGYRWYSHGSFSFSTAIRQAVKLRGGEDPLATAVRALDEKDRGEVTRNTAYQTLLMGRDLSIPLLRDEIKRNDKDTKYTAISLLGQIRTPKAADELLRQYKRGDKHVRDSVRSAAAYRPYLQVLKPVYRDLLSSPGSLLAPAEAARLFGWSDFVPALRQSYPRAEGVLEAMTIHEAIDRFTTRKIDENVRAAARAGQAQPRCGRSHQLLAECPDPVYRTLAAFRLLTYATKGGAPYVDEGKALLETVPVKVKAPLIKRFRMDYLFGPTAR